MRSHLLLIKVFSIVGAVWLYVIHPKRVPTIQKSGTASIIEHAARFTLPEMNAVTPKVDIVRISGVHRELSLREVSSIAKPSAKPLVKALPRSTNKF